MGSYLIYHPRRCLSVFGDLKVYHDPIGMEAMNERQMPDTWISRCDR